MPDSHNYIEKLNESHESHHKKNITMDMQLSQEIERVLSTMRRQNREIRKLILKDNGMRVTKCTGKSKSPKFDLRTLNEHLIR